MLKRTIIREVRDVFPDRAMDFAGRVGDGLRDAMPDSLRQMVPVGAAGKWLQTGVALGAARTGIRAAGSVARRHPVALTAAAVGIGAALYAVARHRRKLAQQDAIEGRSQRIRSALDTADEGTDSYAADLGVGAERFAD